MSSTPKSEQGQFMAGASRALADDLRKMLERATARLRSENPAMASLVAASATGITFYELLAEVVASVPEKDRALLRAKMIEHAENTAAGLPTATLKEPRN